MAAILNSTMLDSDTAILDSAILHKTLTQTYSIWLKLIHSHSTWWWQPSSIWPSWIQSILVFPLKLTHTCQDWFPPFAQKKLHSFILTQLDDGSHLEFYHVGLKNFTHSFWLKLMMAVIWNSAMLDSDTLFSSLRFTQKHSHSTLTLTQTSSIWLKFIHSDSIWWWQPSWILPSWKVPP